MYPGSMSLSIHCARLQDEAVSEAIHKRGRLRGHDPSALINVPLAFLGPGWTRRKPGDHIGGPV
jgi:hypothetical protein